MHTAVARLSSKMADPKIRLRNCISSIGITAVSRRQLSFPNGKLGMGMGIRQQIYDLTALSLRPRHCKEDETLLLDSSHPVKVGCTLKIVDYGFPFCK